MDQQLELLLEIQDLRMQRRELTDGSTDLEAEVFDVKIEDAIRSLDEKVEELAAKLTRGIRERYRRIADKAPRVVAPVINGICYGCFVAVSTARASEADRNLRVESCEYCGCFLYHVG
ncbi:hypothetical protein [Candidatus Palauibacter polyketidifaciens]|uniref:hypothetical protein n=1 Tax=Candidatus Palauibacter polyketidifaciens TaxID=3056740 RepID=UPI00238A6321|nr:hypothetical protein [Candidatus Palauibacter polyketidifaciens]MDE2719659.1 hypothetical protein [Candidatus Palauibacter polyketidifaciens]